MANQYSEFKKSLTNILGVGLSLFIIHTILRGQYSVPVQRGTILMIGAIMIFLSSPSHPYLKSKLPRLDELINWLEIIIVISSVLYVYAEWFEIAEYRPGAPNIYDLIVYALTILVVFEMTRRTSGMTIPLVTLFFIAYLLFGEILPGIFRHSPISIRAILEGSFGLTGEGIYGLVLSVMVGTIYIFVIYGAFLKVSGAGDVFVKLAYIIAGRLPGGAAQTAVFSSALFGSISGSPPANVMATGNFTIPLMISVGYRPAYAGAVEASASTVGQFMPPVMGVGAFIMSEITGIPYLRICLAALLPALLYSTSLAFSVYLEAKKEKIGIIPPDKIPKVDLSLIRQAAILAFSLAVLIYMLIKGSSASFSCLAGIIALTAASFCDQQMKMTPRKILEALSKGAQDGLPLLSICAILGIAIYAINATGIGLLFSQVILSIAHENLLLTLTVTMLAAVILGMGLPTVPAYLMVVLVMGMALKKMGIDLLQIHLFVFYYACLCTITPPVAIAAYTGANIAKANPMETGFIAWRLSLVGFIIPYLMIFNPEIIFQTQSYLKVFLIFLFSLAGILSLSAFIHKFLIKPCSLSNQIMLFFIAAALFYPLYLIKAMGLAGLIVLLLIQKRRNL